jgi:hypothetical protein
VLRPFWLHQAAEYLIGLVLVAVGLQSLEPLWPTLAGGLVILNAAVVDGPIGAFRLTNRRQHRIADLVVIGLIVLIAAMPFLSIDNASRAMMIGTAVVLGFVWWNSSFERPRAATAGQPVDRSEAIGRGAGRIAGNIARAVRDRSK